jgi:hypothetical protein
VFAHHCILEQNPTRTFAKHFHRPNSFLSLLLHLIDLASPGGPAPQYILSAKIQAGRKAQPKLLKYKLRFTTGIKSHLHGPHSTPKTNPDERTLVFMQQQDIAGAKLIDSRESQETRRHCRRTRLRIHQRARSNLYLAQYKVRGWVTG